MRIVADIHAQANPQKAQILQRFFKTGPGEYGNGDKFLGLTVPTTRAITKKYRSLKFRDVKKLFGSEFHEVRLAGVLILVDKFTRGDQKTKKEIYDFYLKHTEFINNWDLVDLSADKIVGAHLFDKDRAILSKLARSKNLWQRRIAIIATYCFIKQGEFDETLKIAEILLNDKHDLIQKAVGWMLREVGNRSLEVEESFLRSRYQRMPRTMLRYAIEKFPQDKRAKYLARNPQPNF